MAKWSEMTSQSVLQSNVFKSPSRRFRLFLLLILLPLTLSAQETTIVGQVLNKTDQSPIPNVNIYFKDTNKGVQSNEEGYFLIRTMDEHQTVLVFSAIGFKKTEIKIKHGQSTGIQVELKEENTLLQEVFILPGSNPAYGMIKKVRLLKNRNDVTRHLDYKAISTEQNLVLLNKVSQQTTSKRLFEQLHKGSLSKSYSDLVIPLYMAETRYMISSTKKDELSKNIFKSPEFGEKLIEKLVGEVSIRLNFYENTVTVFGKKLVSPLSSMGKAYYDYYLADSINTGNGKQYKIHFHSKNPKNLAFEGRLWIDSASYSLTEIEAELPQQANINFISNLKISQKFSLFENTHWLPQSEEMALNFNYELLADSLHPKPEIFIKRSAVFQLSDSIITKSEKFAHSNFSETTLNDKLNELNNTPILRTAKWLADIIFTGYIPAGKIDIGKIQRTIRITDIEGLRLTMPWRTNEKFLKNVSLGGYAGYGFRNQVVKYSGQAQFKIPSEKRRLFSLNYTNDYRRIDYNYNDFQFRENPLATGDVDIASTVFSLSSGENISDRREYSISYANDWNSGIESSLYLRSNKLLANSSLPMVLNGTNEESFLQQYSATLATRFSFDEKTYDDHMQRIYISNKKPVIYSILEIGKYKSGSVSGNYGKIMATLKQVVSLDFAELEYNAETGIILGKVPYPLLQVPSSILSGGYSTYRFKKTNYREYRADKYINFHSELMFNGQITNQIPVFKHLNLREICSFNLSYGGLSSTHKSLLDYPSYMYPLSKPYIEVGMGFSNILKIFSLQSVWRFSELNQYEISHWGLKARLRLRF